MKNKSHYEVQTPLCDALNEIARLTERQAQMAEASGLALDAAYARCARLTEQRDALLEACEAGLHALVCIVLDEICARSHHSKKERHEIGQDCPNEEKGRRARRMMRAAIEKARTT